jgi:hypothetical protein
MPALEETVRQLQKDVRTLNDAMVEHRVRLENGSHVFAKQHEKFEAVEGKLEQVQEELRPKPPSVLRIVIATFGVFVTLSGALWYLSEKLADRPTTDQLRNVMEGHQKAGHHATQEKIGEMREDLVEQRALIKEVRADQATIQETQKDASEKLDLILKRVPRTRRPNR